MLDVYVLRRASNYDEYDEITVVAKDKKEALELANKVAWGFSKHSSITKIDLTKSQCLTASYNAS